MQDSSVEKLFKEQADYYSMRDQSATVSPIIPLFLDWAKNRRDLSIAEFGGAAGQLLDQIIRRIPSAKYTNIEIIDNYRHKQVSNKIKFVLGSILKPPFGENTFDAIIIRDVLHHLVGQDVKTTVHNQLKALRSLKRLLKPSGRIFIEELVTSSSTSAKIIFYLSRLNSKIGLRLKSFEVSPNTVVFFLTSNNLQKMIADEYSPAEIIRLDLIHPWRQRWQNYIVHLGAKTCKAIVIIRKGS